jgi:hypothetical protein
MSAMLAEMNQAAAAGLAALLNTLWYAGAVVVLAWVGLRFCPRVNAATRYWIWTGVLGFLLTLPFLPGLVTQARTLLAAREEAATVAPLATVPAPPASVSHLAPAMLRVNATPGSNPWPLWLLAAWVIAAGWQLTRLVISFASARRLKARAGIRPRGSLSGSPRAVTHPLAAPRPLSPKGARGELSSGLVAAQGALLRCSVILSVKPLIPNYESR